ncbi:MAG: acetate--CoA ligase family protein [Candidatus Helarchaeota archaeon]
MSAIEIIDRFFNPRSIALIGASRKPFGAANMIITGLLHKRYPGEIYLINNKAKVGEKLYGLPLYKSIMDCPQPDLVFIIVPGKYVKAVIQDCIDRGIKNGVIISSGFKESILYDERKVTLEQEIVTLARSHGMRLIGPNCNGIVNIPGSFYAFFGPRIKVGTGPCSYVTRGGTAGGFILMDSAKLGRGLGVNKLVNIGDACDLTIADFIQYYDHDPTTKIIGVYTEGITNGSALLKTLRQVKKPVIFYKSGQTEAGQRAALSHVGALASSNTMAIYNGFISQAGIISVDSIQEMLDIAAALSHSVMPQGKRIGIFTFGGSLGVMMTDTAAKHGLDVAPLNQAQIEYFNRILPEYWSHSNPIDVTDGSNVYDPRVLLKIFSVILEGYDALFIIAPVFENDELFDYKREETNFRTMYREFIRQNIRRFGQLTTTGKPVFMLGDFGETSELFYQNGVPVYDSFERLASTYAKLYQYVQRQQRKKDKEV